MDTPPSKRTTISTGEARPDFLFLNALWRSLIRGFFIEENTATSSAC